MTTDEAISKVVSLAYDQVGYKEGNNNYNKYADDLKIQKLYGWGVQNQPWCAVFVNWLFLNAFGYDDGSAMTYGGSPGCAIAAQNYKNHNAWSMNPRKGDQIFFNINGGINHTGIVVDVFGSTIRTVEGNSSDRVSQNSYYTGDPSIAGYGVPNWSVVADVPDVPDETDPDTEKLLVDGECGENTWAVLFSEMPLLKDMPIVKFGSTGWAVAMCQAMLNYLGANLDTDGDCGAKTKAAIMKFQRDYNNGKFT